MNFPAKENLIQGDDLCMTANNLKALILFIASFNKFVQEEECVKALCIEPESSRTFTCPT
jgi:hypothetical protein